VQARGWLDAGYTVIAVTLFDGTVTFEPRRLRATRLIGTRDAPHKRVNNPLASGKVPYAC